MLVSLTNLSLFFGMLVVLIGISAVVILWVKKRKAAKAAKEAEAPPAAPPGPAPAGQEALPALFREAATRLKLAPRMQGAKLSSLPLILIVGPEKSGKTSVVMRSGLDPELLAGQVYQDTEIIPTASVNIWLARQTLLVELAAPLARDAAALGVILKHLMPGRIALAFRRRRPARSILLCLNQGPLAGAGTTEEVAAAARPWNQSLTAIANSLGSQVPVYVLFTNLDSVAGFSNFVANLAAREPEQAVGATIRPFNPAGRGAYAEETARVVNSHFSQVVYSLCDTRVPLLLREQDRVEAALQYQFPRDFQRLQKNLAQFLVELAKPSQLSVSPFLRGFYFSGIRKVVVEQSAGLSQASLREPLAAEPMVATTVFDPEKMRGPAPAAPQRPAARTNTEWLFVRSLFDGVLFRDRSAQGVSTASSRADKARAVVFGLVALLGLMLLAVLSISYVRNRALERQLRQGAADLRDPKTGSIEQRLEKMRLGVDRLIEYRTRHTPVTMSFGLYFGDVMLPAAQEIYCSPMRAGILPATLSRLAGHLKVLGTASGDPDADFDLLKTYMMVTTNPDKADPGMDDVLFNMWKETPGASANAAGIENLPAEFQTYLELLPIPDRQTACVNLPAAGIIESAQQHFRDLRYDDHYQSLLQQAGARMKAVSFDQMFPNPAVTDSYVVKGWFTKGGWEQMQRILSRPLEDWKSSDWVLNESKPVTNEEISRYRVRYVTDYKNAWLSYLSAARVTPYKSINDAAKALDLMSGEQSPLLSLLGIASDHTAVDDDTKSAFQSVPAVAPSTADFKPANDYRRKLAILKNRLDSFQPTGPEHDRAVQAVQDAADSVTALTLSFKGEASEPVKKILKAPLTAIEPLLVKQGDDAVNSAGQDLCTSYNALIGSHPFAPSSRHEASLDDVGRVFQPDQGLMWTFYNSHLAGSLDCASGGCRANPAARFPLSPGFIDFFSGLYRISHLLYSGSEPVVRLQMKVQQFNSVKNIDFVVDGATTSIPAGSSGEISWNLRSARSFKVVGDFVGVDSREILFGEKVGGWALFDWLYVDSLPASRGSGVFHWVLTSGADPLSFANGRKKEYEIEVRSGDRDVDLKSLQAGPCRLPVAR